MDKMTIIGLVIGIITIMLAVISGSSLWIFFNVPGLMIVVGGTFAATLIKFPMGRFFNSFKLAFDAFHVKLDPPQLLIQQSHEMVHLVRTKSMMALDSYPLKNDFFKKGVQLCIDGRSSSFIQQALTHEMQLTLQRHEIGERVFRAIGDSAPAFGMIGTLIGLVQMLSNMEDPKTIGPAMAIALLTTLYGALIANLVALPIADKLQINAQQERTNMLLIIESVLAIQKGQNPRQMDEMLESYLPPWMREETQSEAVADTEEEAATPAAEEAK